MIKAPLNPLQKQLDEKRFIHGIEYVESSAGSLKTLSSSELAHLNNIVTGLKDEPWRLEAVKIQIPSGHVHEFQILSNPINQARHVLSNALELAGNDRPIEGAAYLYTQLVMEHLFKQGNRRTAVLATYWLLESKDIPIDVHELLALPIGNFRDDQDRSGFEKKILFTHSR